MSKRYGAMYNTFFKFSSFWVFWSVFKFFFKSLFTSAVLYCSLFMQEFIIKLWIAWNAKIRCIHYAAVSVFDCGDTKDSGSWIFRRHLSINVTNTNVETNKNITIFWTNYSLFKVKANSPLIPFVSAQKLGKI